MSVTINEAIDQLNLEGADDLVEVGLYVDAANEWVESKITDTSPAPVKLAILFLIDHLWDIQRRHHWEAQRGPSLGPDFDDDLAVRGIGFSVPNRVLELLQPYFSQTSPTYSFPDAVAWPDGAEWS